MLAHPTELSCSCDIQLPVSSLMPRFVLRRVLAVSVDRGSKKDRGMAEKANLGRSDSKHNKLHTTALRGQIQIAEIDRAFLKKHLAMSLLAVLSSYTGHRERGTAEVVKRCEHDPGSCTSFCGELDQPANRTIL